MKSRKALDHAQLVAEVFRQLATFRPNVKVSERSSVPQAGARVAPPAPPQPPPPPLRSSSRRSST